MTISTTDIKLRTPERLTDLPDGGGRQTSGTVVDGQLNNIFQDTSRLDRVTGRVSLRKVFMHVDTANVDTLLGAHVILTDPPDDDYTYVSVFATGSPTDERDDARDRVESYVISGPEAQWTLYGLHITGQRTVRLYCRAETASPEAGTVLLLSTEASGYTANAQYVRIDSIDAPSLALLKPGPSGEPRRVRVTINGHAWAFLIEAYTEGNVFGNAQYTARGRSITAVLTRDYAPARTRVQTAARNANQLADEELDGTGYTVDWQGPTWLVPGGLWSYVDQAPLDALRSIAEACGCVLQSHQTDPVVRIIPAFKARPWVWAITAPDVDIVDDYTLSRNTGTAMGVRHNFVEVRGETTGGIRGEVSITGTGGDTPLPQVSHPLITAYAAAEARGIYELSRVGPIGACQSTCRCSAPQSSLA